MARRVRVAAWSRLMQSGLKALTGPAVRAGRAAVVKAVKQGAETGARALRPPPGAGAWLAGVAMGTQGARRYRLYRPLGLHAGERVPLVVMLHGCGQDAKGFATATRMNRIADRERFLVLYPEQDRLANVQGCWNWFDTDSGRAFGEAALILKAIDQVALLYPVDRARVAVAGMSAGASMAALLAARHPERFKAVVMHSGVPPGTAHSGVSAMGAMHGLRPTVLTGTDGVAPWPPLLVIHGASDGVVSARNGQAAATAWAEAAGARAGTPRRVQRGQRHAATVTDFRRGTRLAVRLVQVDRLAHAWSGGARQRFSDPLGPDASRLAWSFIARALGA